VKVNAGISHLKVWAQSLASITLSKAPKMVFRWYLCVQSIFNKATIKA
jgi:hypothetical protein